LRQSLLHFFQFIIFHPAKTTVINFELHSTMKVQTSALLMALAASSTHAFVAKSGLSMTPRVAVKNFAMELDTFDLPSIDEEVSVWMENDDKMFCDRLCAVMHLSRQNADSLVLTN
jgi:hypothetical protein